MVSCKNLIICSVLALGASAQNEYGLYVDPAAQSYKAANASVSATPSASAPSSQIVAQAATSQTAASLSAKTEASSLPPQTVASSQAPQATKAASACPVKFDADCAFLCSGQDYAPSCQTEWWFTGESSCTPCPGIPNECPATPAESCAFLCQAQGAASTGETETKFCQPNDISAEGTMTCSPCGGGIGGGASLRSVNATSVTPPAPYNASSSNYGNGTTSVPPPIYTSGSSILSVSGSAIVGLFVVFLTL